MFSLMFIFCKLLGISDFCTTVIATDGKISFVITNGEGRGKWVHSTFALWRSDLLIMCRGFLFIIFSHCCWVQKLLLSVVLFRTASQWAVSRRASRSGWEFWAGYSVSHPLPAKALGRTLTSGSPAHIPRNPLPLQQKTKIKTLQLVSTYYY